MQKSDNPQTTKNVPVRTTVKAGCGKTTRNVPVRTDIKAGRIVTPE